MQANIDVVRLLVTKLKGKAKVTTEVKARFERVATELESLEADSVSPKHCPPSTPCQACPPAVPCPPAPEANRQLPKPEVMAIINGASNLCLGVKGGHQHRAGTGIELAPCLNNQWKISNSGRGAMQLKNRVSGLCLSVQGANRHWIGALGLLDRCDGPRDGKSSQWDAVPFPALMPSLVVRAAPAAPVPSPRIEPISATDLSTILKTVEAQSFAAEKMRVLNMALRGKPVTVAQVRTVIGQSTEVVQVHPAADLARLRGPTSG